MRQGRARSPDRPGDRPRGRGPRDQGCSHPERRDRQLEAGDIAICGDWIVGTYDDYRGAREIDGRGLIATPGFIDTHVHVESSLVTPGEFDRQVLPRGTTTAICDPHEIANVLGLEGLRYFLEAAQTLRMTLKVQLSSCVPATDLETSGARLLAERPGGPARSSIGARPRRDDEFSGRAGKRPGGARQAGGVRGLARRRPCAAGARLRPQRLSGGRAAHRPRDALARGGRGEARQGPASADPRGQHRQERRGAGALAQRGDLALDRVLHRRSQPARDRGRGPHRLRDPQGDPSAARRRSRPIGRRPSPRRARSACSIAARSRPAGAPTSCCWAISRAARSSR